MTLPPSSRESVATLVYVVGVTEPIVVMLPGANGWYRAPGRVWRLIQLLQRSGSRFI